MALKVLRYPHVSMLKGITLETSYFYIEHIAEQVVLSASQEHEIDEHIYQQLDIMGSYLLSLIEDSIASDFELSLFKKIYEAVCTNKNLMIEYEASQHDYSFEITGSF